MERKRCNLSMIQYELRNINGNFMVHFFGFVFPNLMCLILSKTIGSQVLQSMRQEIITSIMLSMSLVIPMSIMLLGYGAIYSQEVEKGVPLRMRLFGFHERSVMIAKLIAHLIFMTIGIVIFGVFQAAAMDIEKPSVPALICLLLSLYIIGICFFLIAHAIGNIFKKFSISYGILMFFYFMLMILTGMMGMKTEQLPDMLKRVAKTLPMTYISNDFIDFWQGGSYNFMPFIQSVIFFGAVSGLLLLFSMYKNRRALK